MTTRTRRVAWFLGLYVASVAALVLSKFAARFLLGLVV